MSERLIAMITDSEYPDNAIEREILAAVDFEVRVPVDLTPAAVREAAREATALLVRQAKITREVMGGSPELRVISRYGVGVDTIDLAAATEFGIWVANVPDYGVDEVATHSVALILAMIRRLPILDRAVRDRRWHHDAAGALRRPTSLTLGVIGLGRIGREVARRARPFFARVLGADPFLAGDAWPDGVAPADLNGIFTASDVVTLHLPLTDATRGLVDRARLSSMPMGSFIVNTARGSLVDLDALVEALDSRRLAGAALDVLPEEPPPAGHPILADQRVILTPHAAFYSTEAVLELRRKAALNVAAWKSGGRPTYVVVEGRDRS